MALIHDGGNSETISCSMVYNEFVTKFYPQEKYYDCDKLNEEENKILNLVLFNLDQPTAQIEMIKFFQNYKKTNKKNQKYNLFSTSVSKKLKTEINFDMLYNYFAENIKNSNKEINSLDKKIKHLLWNPKVIFENIINEIKLININSNYKHYIYIKDNNPYELYFRICYDENSKKINSLLNTLQKEFGYNYIEIKLSLDPYFYPFKPPAIEYKRPLITRRLINSIVNNKFWSTEFWNYTISLESILLELAKELESLLLTNIDVVNKINSNDSILSELDMNIMGINKVSSNITIDSNVVFELPFPKISYNTTKQSSSYWSSGTGYGHDQKSEWDIMNYLQSQSDKTEDIHQHVKNIIDILKKQNDNLISSDKIVLYNIIKSNYEGVVLLDLTKNIQFYQSLLVLLEILKLDKEQYVEFKQNTINIFNQIKEILHIPHENESFVDLNDLTKQYEFLDEYILEENTSIQLNEDSYLSLVKKEQNGLFELNQNHLFFKNISPCTNKKNIIRIVSEISSLKSNLPINYDSSIVLRTCENIQCISFLIIGPKDTPYHNGIFEFHAYFPPDYPNVVPKVLIETTNGGQFRFNPNLYANGKVCLSLLGTWSGQKGESWNPGISTFLQVLISIQSLIMIEKPYFNEPGYERSMNTPSGIKHSNDYNDNIRFGTVAYSMIQQIKNPKPWYKDFIHEHFKLKKDEILSTIEEWKNERKNSKLEVVFEELKSALINDI